MRSHIRWIFFKNEELGELIYNNDNNENWPTLSTYKTLVLENWQKKLDEQQIKLNKIEIKNNKTLQLKADVQSWFINEYNLLNKPAKRVWLEKQKELKRLELELKVHQYNLDHPKTELEEYEKRCLLKKIEISKRKIGNCKDELKEVEENYEKEKRELCQRIAYGREDLEPFLRESEYWQIGQLQQLLISLLKKDANPKTAFGWYSAWWKKYQDIHPPQNVDEPLQKLRSCISKWQEHNGGKEVEENPYEIWVEEKTNDSLIFVWKPAEQEIETGDKKKVKGKYLSLLKNYLFNYYGEWYEVDDYQTIGYNAIAVIAQKSIFYNYYYYLVKTGGNGIIHHSPIVGGKEICSCANFDVTTTSIDVGNVYELRLGLYKLDKELIKTGNYIEDDGVPIVSAFSIHKSDPREITGSGDDSVFNKIWNTVWDGAVGTVYFLLSERLQDYASSRQTFSGDDAGWRLIEKETYSEGGQTRYRNVPKGKKLEEVLASKEVGELTKDEMYHFLRYHMKATLYWRKKQIWQGNYWLVHTDFRVGESVNPSGVCITIYAGNTVLTRVTESITTKVGGNSLVNRFLECAIDTTLNDDKGQNNRQTERAVISESQTNGGEVKKKETRTKQTVISNDDKKGGGKGVELGKSLLKPSTYSIDHTKAEYTMYQFQHRFFLGGKFPLTMKIDFNDNILSQYRNRREIKGKMRYDYFNTPTFGSLLNNEGFFKASIISLGLPHLNWFREKIESGVYLWKTNPKSFYQKKLTDPLEVLNIGGIPDEPFNVVTISSRRSVGSGWDNVSHLGGGLYVYKDSRLWVGRQNSDIDLMPWLMEEVERRKSWLNTQDNSKWVLKHPMGFSETIKIPSQYLDNSNPRYNGLATCKIFFRFHFYSSDQKSNEGDEMYATEIVVRRASEGNKGIIYIEIVGNLKYTNTVGDPEGLPPGKNPPGTPTSPDEVAPNPINPNQFPSSGNLIPNPTGSGEIEIHVPDVDVSPDPDFDPSLDLDPETDPETDPTKDPDKPIDTDYRDGGDGSNDDDND